MEGRGGFVTERGIVHAGTVMLETLAHAGHDLEDRYRMQHLLFLFRILCHATNIVKNY